ncbi:ThuA domain-containing protein [Emticicia agri]|nr:ThuA domain-containing protein [Emticicia agri]
MNMTNKKLNFVKRFIILLTTFSFLFLTQAIAQKGAKPINVLIIDGQNNHKNWPQTTQLMKGYLEETGLFKVSVATTPPEGGDMETFKPDFSPYQVVLSNYNGDSWSKATKDAFEKFVNNGGGFVSVHAADNAFPEWEAYNKMIGVGGWGNRNEKSGPYVYYDEEKHKPVQDNSAGRGGSHGVEHQFVVKVRNTKHPITKGLPETWLHEKDELYDRLRGPAENMEVLATAYSDKEKRGSGRIEPMLMTITYGKGRVFHTVLGHGNYSQKCKGFITTLQRGTEWVATGKVTQTVPKDFPMAETVSIREN